MANSKRLRITEIFHSLQGEARTVGFATVFIRLTGCPLRCTYCDTEYAFSGGLWMSLDEILDQTQSYNARYVTVTGGEPLAQPDCLALLTQLCDCGFEVSLETSGALSLEGVDPRVSRVMDLKTPASGEVERNDFSNIERLTDNDMVKFVIADREDYDWSVQQIQQYDLDARCELLFSPVHGKMSAQDLAAWMLDDRLNVRFQLQLHKILWGDKAGV